MYILDILVSFKFCDFIFDILVVLNNIKLKYVIFTNFDAKFQNLVASSFLSHLILLWSMGGGAS